MDGGAQGLRLACFSLVFVAREERSVPFTAVTSFVSDIVYLLTYLAYSSSGTPSFLAMATSLSVKRTFFDPDFLAVLEAEATF